MAELSNPYDPSRNRNDAKLQVDSALKQECEQARKNVYDAIQDIEQHEGTIKRNIQHWALVLEKLFLLHHQEWAIDTICAEIVSSLKTVGVTGNKLEYVYEALEEFPRFYRRIDHTITGFKPGNHLEHFYNDRAQQVMRCIQKLESLLDPALLPRQKAQDIADELMDLKDKYILQLQDHKIPVCEPVADDFEGIEDRYTDKISYPKTKPEWTDMCEHFKWNIEARQHVLQRLYTEGRQTLEGQILITPELIEEFIEWIDADTHIWKPFTDKKWRKNILQWFEIVDYSVKLFKHSASTKFKTEDLNHFYRQLTREQIGGNRKKMLEFAARIIRSTPYMYLFMGAWWNATADKRGAEFSTSLSPKLSDKSIK